MRALGFLLAACLCLAYAVLRLDVRTSITDFLPQDERSQLLEVARELSTAPQSRVVVLTLTASTPDAHKDAARIFAESLRASGRFEWVRSGLAPDEQEQLFTLFFPGRVGLLPLPPGEGPVPDAWIAERIRGLRERLGSPLGMVERRIAPEDPLGALASLIERQGKVRGKVDLAGDQLVTDDGAWSVVFASTLAPPFEAAEQRKVADAIDAALARARASDATVRLEWAGLNRFGLASEESIRGDIERISTLSMLGIFILYLLVFRSLREPLVVIVPIAFGCVLAIAVCQLMFGFVHGLTLAFGSSITGVAEDFSTHYFTHRRAIGPEEDNEAVMRRVWPGMLMGGITTVAGVLTLAVSGFPGLEQMAVFGSVGVLGALFCTRYVVPALMGKPRPVRPGRLGPIGQKLVDLLTVKRRHALWLLGPALLAIAVGLPMLRWQDGMSALRTPTPDIDAENERVQHRLGRSSKGRVIVALGESDEQALQRAEQVRGLLSSEPVRGLVAEFRSATELIPSVAAQQRTRARLADDPTFVPRLHAQLTEAGFVPSAFAPFEAELTRADPVLLTPAQVLASPLKDMISPFRTELPMGVAYLTPVTSSDPAALGALIQGHEGIHYIDQEALFNEAYGRFRSRTFSLTLVGLVLVLATLLARYRSVKIASLGMVPALVGAGAALGVQGMFGIPATLMQVIAVLLVLSMGVDYGIYVLESRHSAEEGVVTLGSVLLAALTTVLSFGVLGFSGNPALAGIGVTASLGMLFTVLASPVVLVWTRVSSADGAALERR